ncbi:hemolysin family protein [Terrilactibacillus laevilacticus]|uniref:Hemolysin family protein n=1 Tax=Terrilactibacillus laevilacticus TaxID=1380157 RepID=A0ABW5PQA9_9BACI|nr:hemolysin family protein [Terrilactibacillus laevilacticus]
MILQLIILILLIIITAFFVATEFAIVRVRKIKIDTLAETGDKKALAAKRVIEHMDTYLSATQLGITMTSLGIGWLGEPAVGHYIHEIVGYIPLGSNVSAMLSTIIAFLVITIVNVVLGELTPKTFAIQSSEKVTLLAARPLIFFYYLLFPFIWFLNKCSFLVSKLFGVAPMNGAGDIHSEADIRYLLSESYKGGEINQAEYRYVNRIFEFDDRIAREIMVPRTEMACIFMDHPLDEAIETMLEQKYTRYPVVREDKDHIVGFIHIKSLLRVNFDSMAQLDEMVRPVITVLESIPIKQLLLKMQKEHTHIAILFDEYGGTSGLVTVEDILEEIVGEIRDEFDDDEKPIMRKKNQDEYIIDGKMLVDELNRLFDTNLEHEEFDTIGGFILSKQSDIDEGTVITTDELLLEVLSVNGNQIKQVSVKKIVIPEV